MRIQSRLDMHLRILLTLFLYFFSFVLDVSANSERNMLTFQQTVTVNPFFTSSSTFLSPPATTAPILTSNSLKEGSYRPSFGRKDTYKMVLPRLTNQDKVVQQNCEEKLILSSDSPQKTSSGKCTLYDAVYDYGKLEVKVKVSNKPQRSSSDGNGGSPLAKEYTNYQKIVKSNPMKAKSYFAKQLEFLTEAPVADIAGKGNNNFQKKTAKVIRKDMIVMEKGIQDLACYFWKDDQQKIKINITKNKIIKSLIESALSENQANMVWTDLRLENFILVFEDMKKNTVVKVVAIDLESCTSVGGIATDCSPEVCPPEVAQFYIRGKLAGIPIQPSYDVWALGMSILRVLTEGDDLFYTIPKNDRNKNINQNYMSKLVQITQEEVDEIIQDKWQKIKDNKSYPFLFDLLQKMLKVDPQKRIKIKDIKFHPYFLSNILT